MFRAEPSFEEIKHLSHVLLDADITDSSLEGLSTVKTCSFLKKFFQELPFYPEEKTEESVIIALASSAMAKAGIFSKNQLLEMLQQIEVGEEKLEMTISSIKSTLSSKKSGRREEKQHAVTETDLMVDLQSLANKFLDTALDEGEVIIPGGWYGVPSGHSMFYRLRIDRGTRRAVFEVYNTGDGLDFHASTSRKDGKPAYYPIHSFTFDYTEKSRAPCTDFLAHLLVPRVLPIVNQEKLGKYRATYIYQKTITGKESLKGTTIPGDESGMAPIQGQRSGTCSFKSVALILQTAFGKKAHYRRFLLSYRLYLLEKHAKNLAQTENRYPGFKKLMKKSLENTARMLDKSLKGEWGLDEATVNAVLRKLATLKKIIDETPNQGANVRVTIGVESLPPSAVSVKCPEPLAQDTVTEVRTLERKAEQKDGPDWNKPLSDVLKALESVAEEPARFSELMEHFCFVFTDPGRLSMSREEKIDQDELLEQLTRLSSRYTQYYPSPTPRSVPVRISLMHIMDSLSKTGIFIAAGDNASVQMQCVDLYSHVMSPFVKTLQSNPYLSTHDPALDVLLQRAADFYQERNLSDKLDYTTYYFSLITAAPEAEKTVLKKHYQTWLQANASNSIVKDLQHQFGEKAFYYMWMNQDLREKLLSTEKLPWLRKIFGRQEKMESFLNMCAKEMTFLEINKLESGVLSIDPRWGGKNKTFLRNNYICKNFNFVVEKIYPWLFSPDYYSDYFKSDSGNQSVSNALTAPYQGNAWDSVEAVFSAEESSFSTYAFRPADQRKREGTPFSERSAKHRQAELLHRLRLSTKCQATLLLSELMARTEWLHDDEFQHYIEHSIFQPNVLLKTENPADLMILLDRLLKKCHPSEDTAFFEKKAWFLLGLGADMSAWLLSAYDIGILPSGNMQDLQNWQMMTLSAVTHRLQKGNQTIEEKRRCHFLRVQALLHRHDIAPKEVNWFLESYLCLMQLRCRGQKDQFLQQERQQALLQKAYPHFFKYFSSIDLKTREEIVRISLSGREGDTLATKIDFDFPRIILQCNDGRIVMDCREGTVQKNGLQPMPLPFFLLNVPECRGLFGTDMPDAVLTSEPGVNIYTFSYKGFPYRILSKDNHFVRIERAMTDLLGEEKSQEWYTCATPSKAMMKELAYTHFAFFEPIPPLLKQFHYRVWVATDGRFQVEDKRSGNICYAGNNNLMKKCRSPQGTVTFGSLGSAKFLNRFESPAFIEEIRFANGSEHWHLPRYGLTFKKEISGNFVTEDGRYRVAIPEAKKDRFGTGFILKAIQPGDNDQYIIPRQVFYLPRQREQAIQDPWIHDFDNQLAMAGAGKKSAGNWTYDDSEGFVSFVIKKDNPDKPVATSPADQIYLAYLYLAQDCPGEALKLLRTCRCQGRPEEIEMLWWILEKLPANGESPLSSRQIAVQMRAIFLMVQTLENFPAAGKIPLISGDIGSDTLRHRQHENTRLRDFVAGIRGNIPHYYKSYHNRINNIPDGYRLTPWEESLLRTFQGLDDVDDVADEKMEAVRSADKETPVPEQDFLTEPPQGNLLKALRSELLQVAEDFECKRQSALEHLHRTGDLSFDEQTRAFSALDDELTQMLNACHTQQMNIINKVIKEDKDQFSPALQETENKISGDIIIRREAIQRILDRRKVPLIAELGRQRTPPSIDSLIQHYATADRETFRQMGILESDIEGLMTHLHELFAQEHALTRLSLIQDALKECLEKDTEESKNKLSMAVMSRDAVESKRARLFQYIKKLSLRPEQAAMVNLLIASMQGVGQIQESARLSAVLQMIMGGGKTKVILPLLMAMLADGETLAMVMVPESQLDATFRDLRATAGDVFGQEPFIFHFSRTHPDHPQDLLNLLRKLNNARKTGQFVVFAPASMQALELKYLEILQRRAERKKASSLPDARDRDERMQIEYLQKMLTLIRTKGVVAVDEGHQVFYIRRELNYGTGEKQPVGPNIVDATVNLFSWLSKEGVSVTVDGKVFSFRDILDYPGLLHGEGVSSRVLEAYAARLTDGDSAPAWVNNLIQDPLSLKDLHDFITGRAGDRRSKEIIQVLQGMNRQIFSNWVLLREQFTVFLPATLQKTLHENYGPPPSDGFMAVPYRANNVPTDCEFANFIEAFNYTAQMIYCDGVPRSMMIDLLRRLQHEAMQEKIENPSDLPRAEKIFNSIFGKYAGQLLQLNISDEALIQEIFGQYRKDPDMIRSVLRDCFSRMTLDTALLRQNAVNLADMFGQLFVFTGTPHRTFHPKIHINPETGLLISGRIRDYIRKGPTKIVSYDGVRGETRCTSEVFLRSCVTENIDVRALIDCGGRLRGMSNVHVAQYLATLLKAMRPGIRYVLFYQGDALHALNISDGRVFPLPGTDAAVLKAVLGCGPEGCFTYFDQEHTTATDISQSESACAILTVAINTGISDFLQAAMRMRKLGKGQTLVVVPDAETTSKISLSDPDVLFRFLENNQSVCLRQDHFRAALKKLENVFRSHLVRTLLNETDPDRQAMLCHFSESFFLDRQNDDVIGLYAQGQENSPVSEILNTYTQKLRIEWVCALRNAECYTVEEEKSLVGMLSETAFIIAEAEKICDPLQKSRPESSGKMVQQQSQKQTQQQRENEQQRQTLRMGGKNMQFLRPIPFVSDLTLETDFNACEMLLPATNPDFEYSPHLFSSKSFLFCFEEQKEIYTPMSSLCTAVLFMRKADGIRAVLIRPEEAEFFLSRLIADPALRDHCWITTMNGDSFGKKPSLNSDEEIACETLLEQAAFFNGRVDILSKRKTLRWLSEKTVPKMDFMTNTIAPAMGIGKDSLKKLEDRLAPLNSWVELWAMDASLPLDITRYKMPDNMKNRFANLCEYLKTQRDPSEDSSVPELSLFETDRAPAEDYKQTMIFLRDLKQCMEEKGDLDKLLVHFKQFGPFADRFLDYGCPRLPVHIGADVHASLLTKFSASEQTIWLKRFYAAQHINHAFSANEMLNMAESIISGENKKVFIGKIPFYLASENRISVLEIQTYLAYIRKHNLSDKVNSEECPIAALQMLLESGCTHQQVIRQTILNAAFRNLTLVLRPLTPSLLRVLERSVEDPALISRLNEPETQKTIDQLRKMHLDEPAFYERAAWDPAFRANIRLLFESLANGIPTEILIQLVNAPEEKLNDILLAIKNLSDADMLDNPDATALIFEEHTRDLLFSLRNKITDTNKYHAILKDFRDGLGNVNHLIDGQEKITGDQIIDELLAHPKAFPLFVQIDQAYPAEKISIICRMIKNSFFKEAVNIFFNPSSPEILMRLFGAGDVLIQHVAKAASIDEFKEGDIAHGPVADREAMMQLLLLGAGLPEDFLVYVIAKYAGQLERVNTLMGILGEAGFRDPATNKVLLDEAIVLYKGMNEDQRANPAFLKACLVLQNPELNERISLLASNPALVTSLSEWYQERRADRFPKWKENILIHIYQKRKAYVAEIEEKKTAQPSMAHQIEEKYGHWYLQETDHFCTEAATLILNDKHKDDTFDDNAREDIQARLGKLAHDTFTHRHVALRVIADILCVFTLGLVWLVRACTHRSAFFSMDKTERERKFEEVARTAINGGGDPPGHGS